MADSKGVKEIKSVIKPLAPISCHERAILDPTINMVTYVAPCPLHDDNLITVKGF